jgi:hypothetical protein
MHYSVTFVACGELTVLSSCLHAPYLWPQPRSPPVAKCAGCDVAVTPIKRDALGRVACSDCLMTKLRLVSSVRGGMQHPHMMQPLTPSYLSLHPSQLVAKGHEFQLSDKELSELDVVKVPDVPLTLYAYPDVLAAAIAKFGSAAALEDARKAKEKKVPAAPVLPAVLTWQQQMSLQDRNRMQRRLELLQGTRCS